MKELTISEARDQAGKRFREILNKAHKNLEHQPTFLQLPIHFCHHLMVQ